MGQVKPSGPAKLSLNSITATNPRATQSAQCHCHWAEVSQVMQRTGVMGGWQRRGSKRNFETGTSRFMAGSFPWVIPTLFRLFRQFGNKTKWSGCVTSPRPLLRAAEELLGQETGQERPETEKWDSSTGRF